jgi:integrase/recombinase XerD
MKRHSLKAAVAFYLESRRRLGFALRQEGSLLENLVAYAQQTYHRGPLTASLAVNWAQVPPPSQPYGRACRLEAVRHFARFWAAFDPRTQIPPPGIFGPAYRRRSVHIYTPQEILLLLETAQQLPSLPSLYPQTFSTLLGLLACTGLRISEALHLDLADWQPDPAVLTIRRSKFGRSRYVPLLPSATGRLKTHLQARAQAWPKTTSTALFLNPRGQRLAYWEVNRTFLRLRYHLGWQGQRPRPRLHDLRHTFAVNCLLGWYRKGQSELDAKVLSLAVYLGHRSLRHTYWYLTAVPELLALGSARWAKALAAKKGAGHE